MDPHKLPRRWGVLAAFVLVVLANQMLWLEFAPLISSIEKRYGVSELVASSLLLVFPLLYVVLSIPAGVLTDRRGYRFAVGLGAVVTAAGSAIRIADGTFWALLAGQIVVAVAQPFCVNGISKLVADWFDEEEGAIATGLGTMGMFLGMAIGMAATPPIVAAAGLRVAMIASTGVAVLAAVLFLALGHENAASPPAPHEDASLAPLLRDKRIVLVAAISFLGLGFFNGLTTWLEPMLAPNGIDAEHAGMVGAVLVIGGIVGAVVIPLASDKLRRRKPFLVACGLGAVLTTIPLGMAKSYALLLALGGALGFAFMPAFALLLAMSGELAGRARAGAATSLLMLAGNAGGVVLILAVPPLEGEGGSFTAPLALFVGVLVVTLVLALFAPETFPTAASAGSSAGPEPPSRLAA